MKIRRAYALLLAGAGIIAAGANCGKGSDGAGGGQDAGPTDLTVTWTFSGMPADATSCMAHNAVQVSVVLSGTFDTKLHQSVTEACATGSIKFPGLSVDLLGMPFLEGALLDDKGMTIDIRSAIVKPVPGTTKQNIDFFPLVGMGGAGGMSASSSSKASSSSSKASSSSSSASSSSSSGMGGAPVDAGAD